MPQPAGTLARFEDARAAPYRVARRIMERLVSLGQISHIGQSTDLDVLDRRKVGDDRPVADRWVQQRSAVGWRRLVVELDDILHILADAVDTLAAWPGALLSGQFDPRRIADAL